MYSILGFTGSRAEYYLQRKLFHFFRDSTLFSFSLIVSGAILTESNSQTLSDIYSDNYDSVHKLPLPASISEHSHSFLIANVIHGCEDIISQINPDVCVVYADRYESFGFAVSAFHNKKIVYHLEAGDITEGGTFDDNVRHAISKISHLFASSTHQSFNNLAFLGEEPWRCCHTGLLSYDSFPMLYKSNQEFLKRNLTYDPGDPLVLCTMHPIPLYPDITEHESLNLFKALSIFSTTNDCAIIITSPNHDNGHEIVERMISIWLPKIHNCVYIESLGGQRYHSLMSLGKSSPVIVVGNSSSVIKEAPYYHCHSVNVGSRQLGRESASTQQNVPSDSDAILRSLEGCINLPPSDIINPYFMSHASERAFNFLVEILDTYERSVILHKRWHNPSHL